MLLPKFSFLFLFVFMFCVNEVGIAQDSIVVYYNKDFKGKRPKLGLVLSGGGAKGIAHVGVLRIMERVGLKPDYITGTSMGSIIGGLYAIGYTPDSLERLIENQDWTEVLSNKLNLLNVNMEEKWDYGEYIGEFPIHAWKPGLPQGAIKGQELEMLFNSLTVSVAGDTNFDDFYIPFRAVAVDILKGEPYVFSSGDLAIAMRASMSIPTIMNPVKYRGMLLVDGGLMKNFPVDVCKDMGADIVIGVYTGGELLPEEKLNSLFNILKQSSLLAGIKDSQEQRKNVDLYIEPYLSDLSSADFNSASIFTDRGFQAASRKYADFKKMALYFEQFPQVKKDRPILVDSVFVIGRKYSLSGDNTLNRKLIDNVFGENDKGEWLTVNDIKNEIDLVYGTKLFDKITYDFETTNDSANGLLINYNIQKANDKILTFSIQYKSESKFGLNVGLKYRNLLVDGSKLDLKFRLSEYPAFRARYFSYLGYKIKNGIALNYYFYTSPVVLYDGNKVSGDYYRKSNSYDFTFYHYLNINSELFAGANYRASTYHRNIDLVNPYFSKIKSKNNYVSVGYRINKLNKKYFTQSGSLLNIQANYFWNIVDRYYYISDSLLSNPYLPEFISDSIDNSIRLAIDYTKFSKLTDKLVLENEFNLLVSLNTSISNLNSFLIGGVNVDPTYQYSFWGLPENYNLFSNGWIYRIGMRYNFYDKLYFTAKANLMFSAEDFSKIFDSSLESSALDSYFGYYDNYLFGMGLQLSYESLIGPISITATKASNSSAFWWHVLIGYKF